jgi:hypothetical protein
VDSKPRGRDQLLRGPRAPRLLWRINDGNGGLLGFEHLDGRAAGYRPQSDDLPRVAEAIITLFGVGAPVDLELRHIEQRLADYIDNPDDAELLRGATLLHTDWHPDNVLIVDNAARVVDWAWPTRGAAWIDTACWVVWLISAGHTPRRRRAVGRQDPRMVHRPPASPRHLRDRQERLWAGIAADARVVPCMQDLGPGGQGARNRSRTAPLLAKTVLALKDSADLPPRTARRSRSR